MRAFSTRWESRAPPIQHVISDTNTTEVWVFACASYNCCMHSFFARKSSLLGNTCKKNKSVPPFTTNQATRDLQQRTTPVSRTGSPHEYIHITHYVHMTCILMGATVISWIRDKNPLRRRHAHDSCAGVMSRMNHVHDGVPSVCMTPCA